MTIEEKRKPCPFCNGTDIRPDGNLAGSFDQCWECGARGPLDTSNVSGWNTRAKGVPIAFYWQDIGYPNPNKHGPYFGFPDEKAILGVGVDAIAVPLYTNPQHDHELLGLLDDLALSLECEVNARYAGMQTHPALSRKYEGDMEEVKLARAKLATLKALP